MAIKTLRIGSLVDIQQWDDGDYSEAIETDQPIAIGKGVDPDHAVRIDQVIPSLGPASTTDNAVARWDGINGDKLQNSLVTISDSGSISLPAGESVDGVDISVHAANVSAHHVKYTDAEARASINNIFGSDGKADADIDLDGHNITSNSDITITCGTGNQLNIIGKGHIQTGGVLATDGIIIQATPDNIPALGAPIPEIRGDVWGGLSTVFGLRGGMFLLQNPTDLLAPLPILYFTDGVGDVSAAASIDYDPSTREMKLQNANIYRFIPGSATNFYVTIGPAAVPTGVLHVQRNVADDFPLVKLFNDGSGDVTQSFQSASSDFFSVGLDVSVSGKPFCMSISEKLAVANNAFTIDRANNRTGIKTTVPNSTHDINGSKSRAIDSVSVDTTLGETHETLLVDASGAARNIYLPARSGVEGRIYTVKKIDSSANTVTVNRAGADTIDGATTVVLATQYQARTVQAGPSEWNIIQGYL